MNKEELADLIIERLNEIASHDKAAMEQLIEERVPCNDQMADHPSVQVSVRNGTTMVGALGIINGVVGTIPAGPLKGWGYVAAVFDDDNNFVRFRRTDVGSKVTPA